MRKCLLMMVDIEKRVVLQFKPNEGINTDVESLGFNFLKKR